MTITFKRNGKPKFTYDYNQEKQMFQYLESLGFGYIVLDKKKVIYQIKEDSIKSVGAEIVRDAFWDFLEYTEFEDLPEHMSNHDLLNWYLDALPMKTSKFARFLSNRELDKDQTHQLRMEDYKYAQEFRRTSTLAFLKDHNFQQTIDVAGGITENAPLFFKALESSDYLTFTHYNAKRPIDGGFDVFIATFSSQKVVGKVKPLKTEKVILNFDISTDMPLINPYL